ncbi:hypothetical protein NP233_g3049 [Leucocoprinus birnbaumii]|uniref:NYN domain-containing protein n=1 Tax=Leucocoprinus birnbaumii TaxID=56174 RepID=A0AAD5VX96_9AGAR|nr:hypothetical protein NP233_g3049 [Leucocoprinus birnbaumii]
MLSKYLALRMYGVLWNRYLQSTSSIPSHADDQFHQSPLGAFHFSSMYKRSGHDVAIFWDYENCPAPANASGWETVKEIRRAAQVYGCIKVFRAYLELPAQLCSPDSRSFQLRSELQSSGVSLTDCPHNGRKDVADKMIMGLSRYLLPITKYLDYCLSIAVDMMAHAIDNPAPWTYVLITGDRDFAYAISVLNLRQYQVVLISPSTAHVSLRSQATTCLDWNKILEKLTGGPSRKPVNQEPTPISQQTPTNRAPQAFHDERESDEVDLVSFLKASQRRRQPSVSSSASHSVISDFQDEINTNTAYFSASEMLSVSPSQSAPPITRGHRSDSTNSSDHSHINLINQSASPPLGPPRPTSDSAQGASPPTVLTPSPDTSERFVSPPETTSKPEPSKTSIQLPPTFVPKIFVPLVNILREHLARGSRCPSREDLARVLDQNAGIYSMAKVEKFGQYIALAERNKIVTQGPLGIVLRPEYWS